MKTTTRAKSIDEGTLPKRNATTGRFEKGTARAAKPAAAKAATPAAGKAKKA